MMGAMNQTVVELVQDGDWFGLFTDAYVNAVGTAVFATIFGLLLMSVLYIYSRSVVIPAVMGLFLAGTFSQFLPARASYVSYFFLAIAVSAIIYRMYKTSQY